MYSSPVSETERRKERITMAREICLHRGENPNTIDRGGNEGWEKYEPLAGACIREAERLFALRDHAQTPAEAGMQSAVQYRRKDGGYGLRWITMAMFDGTLAAESYCNLQRKDDKWPFEYRAIELPATPDTSTVEVAQKPREPSITDAMIQAGAKVLNPIAFEEVDNDHLCDVVGARREARSEARKVIVAALSLSSTDRASEGQSLPASIEEIAQMIGVEFRNDPVATRHAAERVYNFLDARISVRAKTLARQATTSGLPHYEGQAVECDGGLHTVSVTSPTGNSNA